MIKYEQKSKIKQKPFPQAFFVSQQPHFPLSKKTSFVKNNFICIISYKEIFFILLKRGRDIRNKKNNENSIFLCHHKSSYRYNKKSQHVLHNFKSEK